MGATFEHMGPGGRAEPASPCLVVPVIMSGGAGTRLWPLSTDERPKQFHALITQRSLLQDTVLRTLQDAKVRFHPPIVICSRRHESLVADQLRAIGCEPAAIVLEPTGRNTAAAAVVAARLVAQRAPGAAVLLASADHVIADPQAFRDAIGHGLAVAEDRIVTFGVEPTRPETGYGYIQRAAAVAPGVYDVARFAEKPQRAVAETYLAQGGYDWNAGIFLFSPAVLLEEMAAHRPDILAGASAALDAAQRRGAVVDLDTALFTATPSQSIDLAVMERTRRAAVAPCSMAWADIGSWSELWRRSPLDVDDNRLSGPVAAVDTARSLIWSQDATVAVVGMSEVIVVASQGSVLVAPISRAQDVRRAVEAVKALTPAYGVSAAAEALATARGRLERWLVQDALPTWTRLGVDRASGAFSEAVAQDGAPVERPRRARVQARQIYVYATAAVLGWGSQSNDQAWRAIVRDGLDHLLSRYARVDGLIRASVHPDGSAADDAAVLYDQAFVLFALAAATGVTTNEDTHVTLARALLQAVQAEFAAPHGGFREASQTRPFQSNPNMHMFEAALAWSPLDPSGPWRGLADDLAGHALLHFIDPQTGVLREFFDAEWRPAAGEDGRLIEPGHQFEWAWLLTRWGQARGRDDALKAADRLYRIGVEAGVDRRRGVAINVLFDDLQPRDASARLWPQTERIKAALIMADKAVDATQRDACLREALDGVRGLELYLQTPRPGLWRDKLDPSGAFIEEAAPASSFYHIVGAIAELHARASKA